MEIRSRPVLTLVLEHQAVVPAENYGLLNDVMLLILFRCIEASHADTLL